MIVQTSMARLFAALSATNEAILRASSDDELYQRVWTKRQAGDEVPLKVLQGVEIKEIRIRSIDHLAYFRPHSTI